jgi:hypothetical protein
MRFESQTNALYSGNFLDECRRLEIMRLDSPGKWDIHASGHCFHEMGLDAYVQIGEFGVDPHRIVGPFGRGEFDSPIFHDRVKAAMRNLVSQIEASWFSEEQFVLFGTIGDDASVSTQLIEVMGTRLPFVPFPSLRCSLWDEFTAEVRESVFSREWQVNVRGLEARHQLGLVFSYSSHEETVTVRQRCVDGTRIQGSNLHFDSSLLELLAEQGYALLCNFDSSRLFRKFVVDKSICVSRP